ncbi:hypothetical protein AVEN_262700-1 [Araneus ventricosus]|uniref:Uncharacterized protein n=1 Tax=Araneus ventricosus TaxID=182803 RepID=A0A4Y2HEW6_ARAVE|nr:hypothetical protein AVEN_262700-1 [Araneus ventricosus]
MNHSTSEHAFSLLLSCMKVLEAFSIIQPGYYETVGNYPYMSNILLFSKNSGRKYQLRTHLIITFPSRYNVSRWKSNHETDSETDMEDDPVDEEYNDSNSNIDICIICPFNI